MRGTPAVVELAAHAFVAALGVAAGWSVWVANPAAGAIAGTAVIAWAIAAIQSLYWTALPHDTMPGDKPRLVALIVAVAVGSLVYLRKPPAAIVALALAFLGRAFLRPRLADACDVVVVHGQPNLIAGLDARELRHCRALGRERLVLP
jgi:hypothetical protein